MRWEPTPHFLSLWLPVYHIIHYSSSSSSSSSSQHHTMNIIHYSSSSSSSSQHHNQKGVDDKWNSWRPAQQDLWLVWLFIDFNLKENNSTMICSSTWSIYWFQLEWSNTKVRDFSPSNSSSCCCYSCCLPVVSKFYLHLHRAPRAALCSWAALWYY